MGSLYLITLVMNIRRAFLWQISKDNGMLKAIALLLYYKNRHVSSCVTNFTYNKLHNETGLHATTLKKRVSLLLSCGLAVIHGKNLVFKRVSSHNVRSNVEVLCDGLSVKEIENSLYASMLCEIQRKKDFVKHTIHIANNPPLNVDYDHFKKMRKMCRKYGWGEKYQEFGISYKFIAKKLNICLQHAFNVVAFAVRKGLINKFNHIEQVFMKGIGAAKKYLLEGNLKNMFITKNNIYRVYANTYSLPNF